MRNERCIPGPVYITYLGLEMQSQFNHGRSGQLNLAILWIDPGHGYSTMEHFSLLVTSISYGSTNII